MMREATSDVPQGMKLTDFSLTLSSENTTPKSGKRNKKTEDNGILKIAGFIDAPKEEQEFLLLKYIKRLLNKKLITNPILVASEQGSLDERPTLKFTIHLTPVTAQ